MLSDNDTALITGYVDGELAPAARRQAVRLLNESAAARRLYRKLESDSRRLKRLARTPAPPHLADRVLHAIAVTPEPATPSPAPVGAAPPAGPAGWPLWVTAAAVLLAVTAASFLFFSGRGRHPELAHAPREGSGARELLRFGLADLRQASIRSRLMAEFNKNNSLRFDLAVKDGPQAVGSLTDALRHGGIRLVGVGGDRPPKAACYLLYVDNLRPDEVTAVLDQFGRSSDAAESVAEVALAPLAEGDRARVAGLLGVGVDQLRPAARAAADDPAGVLGQTLIPGGQAPAGGVARNPDAGERLAVLFPTEGEFDGVGSRSAEVMRFLSARRPPMPGTLQLVLVVQEVRV